MFPFTRYCLVTKLMAATTAKGANKMKKRFQDSYGLKWFTGKQIEAQDVAEIAKYENDTITVGRFYINHTDTTRRYAIYDRLKTYQICDINEDKLAEYLNEHAFKNLPTDEQMHKDIDNMTFDKLCKIALKNGLVKETLLTMHGDWVDFKEVSCWSVADALIAVYNLGKADGEKGGQR